MTLSDGFRDTLGLSQQLQEGFSYLKLLRFSARASRIVLYSRLDAHSNILSHFSILASMPGAAFEAAVTQSRELKAKPTDDELLQVGLKDLIYVINTGEMERGEVDDKHTTVLAYAKKRVRIQSSAVGLQHVIGTWLNRHEWEMRTT